MSLSANQQEEVCRIVRIGCDRETACQYVDCTQLELRESLQSDNQFRSRLRKSEATAEVKYMETIYEAAKDPKNWRTSVWWFERRSPERFARKAATVTAREMKQVTDQLAEMIHNEISNKPDRLRLLSRLESMERRFPSQWVAVSLGGGDDQDNV